MYKFLLIVTVFFTIYFMLWILVIEPRTIVKMCFQAKLDEISKRSDENLNYYYVLTDEDYIGSGDNNEIGKNRPMLKKDLNSKLDEYWGEIAFKDCLRKKGLYLE